jgi:hypothetical protein
VLHVAGENPASSDDNDGSEAAPFRTINRAAKEASPGTKVLIHPGIYRECVQPAMGGTDAALIEQQVALTAQYSSTFFGRELPALPSDEVKDYVARWREAQMNGPETRGSSIFLGLSGPRSL